MSASKSYLREDDEYTHDEEDEQQESGVEDVEADEVDENEEGEDADGEEDEDYTPQPEFTSQPRSRFTPYTKTNPAKAHVRKQANPKQIKVTKSGAGISKATKQTKKQPLTFKSAKNPGKTSPEEWNYSFVSASTLPKFGAQGKAKQAEEWLYTHIGPGAREDIPYHAVTGRKLMKGMTAEEKEAFIAHGAEIMKAIRPRATKFKLEEKIGAAALHFHVAEMYGDQLEENVRIYKASKGALRD